MRIALLTDIHGNREALTACLEHARRNAVERHVFLGDYIGYGAEPAWALETVMAHVERGAVAILGNHDSAAIDTDARMNETAAAAMAWTRTQLNSEHLDFIDRLPLIAEEGARLYVHSSAYEPDKWNYVADLYAASRSLMATGSQATFCGHTHLPALFHMSMTGKFASFEPVDRIDIPLTRQRRWLAVIGSVGQPRDGNPAACYAVIDDERDVLTYYRVPYDIDGAAGKIRAAGLPSVLAQRLYEGF
jgi:diadenosine tetraphosphatase ApaH/serine/threonine PP2A family protein phosphatase